MAKGYKFFVLGVLQGTAEHLFAENILKVPIILIKTIRIQSMHLYGVRYCPELMVTVFGLHNLI